MSSTPTYLDDRALDVAFEPDRVANAVRPFQAQSDPREEVTDGALQREAEHNGDHARRGDQPGDWELENQANNREKDGEVDKSRQQIGGELALVQLVLEQQKGATERDQASGKDEPPEELERLNEDTRLRPECVRRGLHRQDSGAYQRIAVKDQIGDAERYPRPCRLPKHPRNHRQTDGGTRRCYQEMLVQRKQCHARLIGLLRRSRPPGPRSMRRANRYRATYQRYRFRPTNKCR